MKKFVLIQRVDNVMLAEINDGLYRFNQWNYSKEELELEFADCYIVFFDHVGELGLKSEVFKNN